jgi:ABC-type glycerol-3-phosphate transport system substrate-binding protein
MNNKDQLKKGKINTYSRREIIQMAGIGAAGLLINACTPGGAPAVETPKSGAAVAGKKEQTLRVAFPGTQISEESKNIADSFSQKFPGTTVEFVPLQGKDWDEFFSKILTMIAAGNPPDVTIVATEGVQLFAGQGLSVPLDDLVKRDKAEMAEYFSDVHPALVEAMMYEGSLYQLPNDFNAANMYYNTALFKEAGFDHPDPAWDKDTFYNIAKTIAKKDASGQTEIFGYGWVNRLWGSWMPWIFVNDSNLLTEERAPGGEWLWETFYKDDPAVKGRGGGWRWNAPKANDPANIEALEFMVQLTKEGIAPTADVGGGGLLQGFFSNKKLAMTPAGGFWAGGLHNEGMAPDAFDVQLFPKWKSQRHQFGTAGIALMSKAKDKDLAWEYIKHTNQVEAMQITFKGNPTTPVRRSMMTAERYAPTGPKHWQVFYDTLDKHPDTAPIPAPPEANPMTTIFLKYTGLAANAEMTPKDALDAMQKDLEELFAKRKK